MRINFNSNQNPFIFAVYTIVYVFINKIFLLSKQTALNENETCVSISVTQLHN